MNKLLSCRRTFIGFVALVCLTGLGLYHGLDVAMAITGVVASIAGANAAQGIMSKKE